MSQDAKKKTWILSGLIPFGAASFTTAGLLISGTGEISAPPPTQDKAPKAVGDSPVQQEVKAYIKERSFGYL